MKNYNMITPVFSRIPSRSLVVQIFALFVFFSVIGITQGATDYFNGDANGTGDWSVASNWSLGAKPTSSDDVYMKVDNSIATITQPGEVCNLLYMSVLAPAGATTKINMESGSLTVSGNCNIPYDAGATAIFMQSGGAVTNNGRVYLGSENRTGALGIYEQSGGISVMNNRFYIGNAAGSRGEYNISGGTLDVVTPGIQWGIGLSGTGIVNQTDGIVTSSVSHTLGQYAGSYGEYNLSGGLYESGASTYKIIGSAGTGVFNQTGGTNVLRNNMTISGGAGSGTYNLESGELYFAAATVVEVGTAGTGIFKVGPASIQDCLTGPLVGSSTISLPKFGGTGTAVLRAWGDVPVGTINVYGCGKIIADGFGQDRTLDMTGVAYNTTSNTTGIAGVYAQDHGKLTMTVDTRYNENMVWGTQYRRLSDDFVNSVLFDFASVAYGKTITGSLYASDYSGIDVNVRNPVGIWEFSINDTFIANQLVFRYDDTAVTASGLDINEMSVYKYNSVTGKWDDITDGTADTVNKTISTVSQTELGMYAVGWSALPKGTYIIIN